jgi:hypothetical protein
LEKGASLHSRKYFIGDQLVYKLKSDQKQWLEEYISDIYVDEGYLLFDNRIVPLDQIAAIQIRDGGQFARTMSQLITRFGYSWGFWTLVSAGFGDKITPATIGIGVGSILAGQLLRFAFFKTYKVKKRKRLRLIDLTFYETLPNRS